MGIIFMKKIKSGVTLLELLVVILIISILSSIAVVTYTGQVERAKIAAAKAMISQIETACHIYETDVGQFPPSASFGISPGAGGVPRWGCGYMTLALLHSLNGNALYPLDKRWNGPYLDINAEQFGDINGNPITTSVNSAEINILDPWGMPYQYVRFDGYSAYNGTQLPSYDPFRATETYYNINTFQLFSYGPNGTTLAVPNGGTEADDISNFRTK